MARNRKNKFYRSLNVSKSIHTLIKFYNDWLKEAQKELNRRK